MRLRRRWYWWVLAAAYIAAVLTVMPEIERYFTPFPFHVLRGPQ
jgi:hypothetical protein